MPSQSWTPARHAHRERSNRNLLKRLKERKEEGQKSCWVFDCKKPSGSVTEGSLGRFCEKHAEHYRRHGCPWKDSYRAVETNPYRRAALRWLWDNPDAYWVKHSIGAVRMTMHMAGRSVPANNTRGLKPHAKAKAVWAKLREANVDPLFIVAAIVGTAMAFERDTQRPSGRWGNEYRRVQIAKVLNRMAGGTIKRWARPPVVVDEVTGRTAVPPPMELRAFMASSGRMLRFLGKEAEETCEWILAEHLQELLALFDTLPKTKASEKTPWPDKYRARPKPRIPDDMKPTGALGWQKEQERQHRLAADKKRRAQKEAAIVKPEQDAARQPKLRTLRNGQWVDEA